MYYIGIDVGGTNIKAGLVNEAGEIIARAKAPTIATRPAEEIAGDIAQLAAEVSEKAGIGQSEIASCGIGIPGACSGKEGVVLHAANLPFRDFPLREAVQKIIKVPGYLGNDANCAALGEYMCLAERAESLVMVTLGTGIGGGLVLDGKLYAGYSGLAGEVGHSVICHGGEMCGCGRRGCWEAYASVTALIRQTKAYAELHPESAVRKACGEDFSALSGQTAFTLYKAGDEDGREVVENWIGYVAEGVVNIINIFQPALLLIGGAISREGETLLEPLRRKVAAESIKGGVLQTEIRAAALGNDAGIIGAAFLGK